jgi:hypothetical protein
VRGVYSAALRAGWAASSYRLCVAPCGAHRGDVSLHETFDEGAAAWRAFFDECPTM